MNRYSGDNQPDFYSHEKRLFKLCSVKRDIYASAKSIDPGQPAHSAQADLGRYFLPLIDFLQVIGLVYLRKYFHHQIIFSYNTADVH